MNLTELKSLLTGKTGSEPKPAGEGFTCRCPAHDDQSASLSFSAGRDGLVLKCHAGCEFDAVIGALGIKTADLFYKNAAANGEKAKIVATYNYNDTDGRLLFQVCRFDPKGFRQRRPALTAPGEWVWDMKGVKLVPYRLPEVIAAAKAGETVFIAEGEKDVAALVANGFQATCNAAGAGKWRDDFAKYFDGAKVVCIIAGKDTPGRNHAAAVAASLKGKVPSVKVIELPDVAGCNVKDMGDATIQAVCARLNDNSRGLLQKRDELSGWLGSFDQYSDGNEAAQWLEFHSASSLKIDRADTNRPIIYVPRALVCVTGTIQQPVLKRLLTGGGAQHFDNGLAARFLMSMPPERERKWREAVTPPTLVNKYVELFRNLLALAPDIVGETGNGVLKLPRSASCWRCRRSGRILPTGIKPPHFIGSSVRDHGFGFGKVENLSGAN